MAGASSCRLVRPTPWSARFCGGKRPRREFVHEERVCVRTKFQCAYGLVEEACQAQPLAGNHPLSTHRLEQGKARRGQAQSPAHEKHGTRPPSPLAPVSFQECQAQCPAHEKCMPLHHPFLPTHLHNLRGHIRCAVQLLQEQLPEALPHQGQHTRKGHRQRRHRDHAVLDGGCQACV